MSDLAKQIEGLLDEALTQRGKIFNELRFLAAMFRSTAKTDLQGNITVQDMTEKEWADAGKSVAWLTKTLQGIVESNGSGMSEASPGTIKSQAQKHLDQINQGQGNSDDRGTAQGIAGMLAMLATVATDMAKPYHGLNRDEAMGWKQLAMDLWNLNNRATDLSRRPRRVSEELDEAFDPSQPHWKAVGGIVELSNELDLLARTRFGKRGKKQEDVDKKILAVLRKLKARVNALDL